MNEHEARNEAVKWLNLYAEHLDQQSRNCITWTDVRANNQHVKSAAATALYAAAKQGLLPGISPTNASAVAQRTGGCVNWTAIRKASELTDAEWLANFDSDTAPPHSRKRLNTDGTIQQVSVDRTADELREWYRRQSLAWCSTLETLASRIGCAETVSADPGSVIPPEYQLQLSKTDAARKYYRHLEMGTDQKRRKFNAEIADGNIVCEKISERRFIFDARQLTPLTDITDK